MNIDHDLFRHHPRMQRYIKELNEEGFEVFVYEDIDHAPGCIKVTVRKDNVKCQAIMTPESYSNYVELDHVLRLMVRTAENKLLEEAHE